MTDAAVNDPDAMVQCPRCADINWRSCYLCADIVDGAYSITAYDGVEGAGVPAWAAVEYWLLTTGIHPGKATAANIAKDINAKIKISRG